MKNLPTSNEKLVVLVLKLQTKVLQLEQENQKLKKRIIELERKTPPDLPFHPKPSIKLKADKKRKKRQHGYARKLDKPTHIVRHAHSKCPDCNQSLYKGWLKRRRQVIDIPLQPATITEHQVFEHWCGNCKQKVSPHLDLSGQVLGNHRVSLRLMSYIATLRERERAPFEEIQSHLKTFYQIKLSLGEITEICHTVADKSLPVYQKLKTAVQKAPVVFGDETGWRQDGVNGYIWNFNTPKFKYLTYRKTRGKIVVEEIIGKEFEGVLVSDFYASYNTHLGYHQRCWVHLLRDIEKLVEKHPKVKQVKTWAYQLKKLYQQAKFYSGPDPGKYPDVRSQQQQRWKKATYFRDKLLKLCKPHLDKNAPMKTLCQRIDKYQDELFLFIADPKVPTDNNSAERSLRHSVIARKISGGTRSDQGSTTKFILASLFGTWKLQNKNPFQGCLNLLTSASTGQPLPATCS